MKRILILLLLQSFACCFLARSQSFDVKDLLKVAGESSKSLNEYMYKNRFALNHNPEEGDSIQTSYVPRPKGRRQVKDTMLKLDYYMKGNSKYFILHMSSLQDFQDGRKRLMKSGFVCRKVKDINADSLLMFQKDNLSVISYNQLKDSTREYIFNLRQRKIPDSVKYAEDLLQFDSREFLVSYFGDKHVSSDLYYFAENNLKKCSVLFSGTPRQVAFIWNDQDNLDRLAYVIISNVLPTKEAEKSAIVDGNNEWRLRNGIRMGMDVRDLLRVNEMDFKIYGNKAELSFMAEPLQTGKIDFKKVGLMFRCNDCFDNKIFNQYDISALDIAKANLPLNIFDIVIYP